jgi:hypothetical protein
VCGAQSRFVNRHFFRPKFQRYLTGFWTSFPGYFGRKLSDIATRARRANGTRSSE